MPPRLRVDEHNSRLDQRLQTEISSSLARVLKTNPNMNPKEALWSIEKEMLQNNPYNPPADGKCPVNGLPLEVLACIFQAGVELQETLWLEEDDDEVDWDEEDLESDGGSDDEDWEDEEDEDSTGSDTETDDDDEPELPFQVLVSHVCRRWRELAIDSHVLWTAINFYQRPRLDKWKTYITRANGLPLKIFIDCTVDEDLDEDHPDHLPDQKMVEEEAEQTELSNSRRFLSKDDLKQILDLIEPEVSHWLSLEVQASSYGYIQLLLSRLHALPAAPLLESFYLHHFEDCEDYDFFSGDDKTAYLPFHGNAPKLNEIGLWGVHIDWDGAVPVFLAGLKILELSYHAKDVRPSYKTFTEIFKNSPNLQNLTLTLSGPALADDTTFDSEEGWGTEPLTISSVKEFVTQFHDCKYASALAQHLDLPNTTALVLNFVDEDYSDFVRALTTPIKGHTDTLLQRIEHLKISGLPCNIGSMEKFLSQLTHLKSLNLKVFGEEEEVIFAKLIDPAAKRTATTSHSALSDSVPPGSQVPEEDLPKVFCPALESITTTEVDGPEVRELVEARRKLGFPLKKLLMSNTDMLSRKDERWLRANLDELDFFSPSDSEDEDSLYIASDDEGEDGDEDAAEGDEPLPTPLAQELGRSGGRRHGADLD